MAIEYVLKLCSPDRPGIVAAVASALTQHNGDIRDAKSFGDETTGEFFIRMQLQLPTPKDAEKFARSISVMAEEMHLGWEFHPWVRRPKVLILVSKFDHCLVDLLHRVRIGALDIDVPLVISNHDTTQQLVEWHGIEFLHLPVTRQSRPQQEKIIIDYVSQLNIELVVLARYMQILSPEMVQALAGRCINIHHSFLPSFKGALPYRQAHERGVKLIGATAHYVTEDLDEGPIIEQDVRRVTHATSAVEMAAIGREIESSVLARAVRWHLEQRIFLNGSKTVVFE